MAWLKADLDTEFQIDWAQWGSETAMIDNMRRHLCASCQDELTDSPDPEAIVDGVDMVTGEVHRVTLIQEHLMACCSQEADYSTPTMSLTQAVFLALLATWDNRLSPVELQKRIGRSDPETILRLLTRGHTRDHIVPLPPHDPVVQETAHDPLPDLRSNTFENAFITRT